MASKIDLKLDKYGISFLAYRELKYFCLQYEEKKSAINSLLCCKGVNYDKSTISAGISDPTSYTAQKLMKLTEDIELIENTAKEASKELYKYILMNVTHNTPYEYMAVPCGRRLFYELRRKFFYLLFLKKG